MAEDPPSIDTNPQIDSTPAASSADPTAAGDALIFGKFKSMEEAEKSYKGMEHLVGNSTEREQFQTWRTQQTPQAPAAPSVQITNPNPPESPGSVEEVLSKAGLNPTEAITKYASNGQLDDGDYQKLSKSGVSKSLADTVFRTYQEAATLRHEQMKESERGLRQMVGGDDQWDNLMGWAANNKSEEEITALNESLSDSRKMGAVIKSLLWDRQRSVGAENTNPMVQAGNTPAPTGGAFGSREEYSKTLQLAIQGDQAAQQRLVQERNPSRLY